MPGFSAAESDWCIPALLDLVRRLAEAHDISVFALRYPHDQRRYRVFDAQVHAMGGGTGTGWRRLPLLWRTVNAIVADARQEPFSILHGMWADEAGFAASVAARRLRVPLLVSLMGGELVGLQHLNYGVRLSRSGRFFTRLALRFADRVSTGSTQFLEAAARFVPRQRLSYLPLGVDLARFRPAAAAPAEAGTRIVHAASLSSVKDQRTLIDAFARARASYEQDNVSLHIAGDGVLLPMLLAHARERGIERHVHFHGAVSHERLPDFYKGGAFFALSSLYESQNVAILEAAACGLPAVGTSVGLLPQLLSPRYLAPPGDAQALSQCMLNMLSDRKARKMEAQRLHSLVCREFGLDQTVSNLVAVYRELIRSHAADRAN